MHFAPEHRDGRARAGKVVTDHGAFLTPAFMPVGTQGTVKAVAGSTLTELGVEIILSNTYHLYLRPGREILRKAGGLHRFMGWTKPILTDSGGFQVFSLATLRDIHEDGVRFQSHLDGSLHTFTPETVVDIQREIGSDIVMAFDECTPYPCDRSYAEESNGRTMRWAKRCHEQFGRTRPLYGHSQALFGIVQGSVFPDIRKDSVSVLTDMDFDGYAIGGLAVGEPSAVMNDIVSLSGELLPEGKPRYLMGVGTPVNLLESIERGIDMFDCVLPTRNARNAMLFTRRGPLNITNARFADDFQPVEDGCGCHTCRGFTRAYLRHLFQTKEILGPELATIHNIYYYESLMRDARQAIAEGHFHVWKQGQIAVFQQGNS